MRVLTARGSELEREFPFGVVRQLFEPPLKRARAFAALGAEVRRARLLADNVRSELYATGARPRSPHGTG